MRQRYLPLLFLAALFSCSKSDSNPIMDFGEGEGITYRAENNQPVGPRDYTDWTSDGDWNKRERALFAELPFDINGLQSMPSTAYTTAYPNPALGSGATWHIELQRNASGAIAAKAQAVLVDRNYHVISQAGPAAIGLGFEASFNYAALGLNTNELYRIYYVAYNPSGILIKGHGDVRYSPQ